ncbi:hypothetical protein BOTNAR_0027g00160 [Botryotinia narcissicola]|uniref:Uncharacterized protein n=1 Tax=Botryotinia narcissicola TaxID=278944 RepID=A0A4Z1J9P8_9HELO|nr:hypothetical protein BOTNAR_0027g00160 [Botryotinia narcissicola]
MSSESPSRGNPIGNEGGKRKHRGSSSVASSNSNSNGKKRERTQPPKDRARTEGGRSSTNRSSSRDSRKSSERSQWSSDGELPESVMSATDLALYRNRENRQQSNDSPPPPHSPPRLRKEKSLDSFPSLSETQSGKIESQIKHIRMKIGWLNPNSSADSQTIAEYERQIRELGGQSRPLRRG